MFTWICPTCGRDVPPSMNECPNCSGKFKAAEPEERVPEQQVAVETPPAAAAPATFAPPPPAMRPAGNAANTWVMSLVFAAVFIALGAGIYWGVGYWKSRSAAKASATPFENPPAGGAAAKPNALQKFVEVTGVRLMQNAKQATEARFLIVNHSPAEVADLAGTVILRAHGSAANSTSNAGTFTFKGISLGPYEAKESKAIVDTKLRVYELPDWQNVIADLTITSP